MKTLSSKLVVFNRLHGWSHQIIINFVRRKAQERERERERKRETRHDPHFDRCFYDEFLIITIVRDKDSLGEERKSANNFCQLHLKSMQVKITAELCGRLDMFIMHKISLQLKLYVFVSGWKHEMCFWMFRLFNGSFCL